MAGGQTYQSVFNYGEVGHSLDGFRDSDIAKQSATKITNFYISEMGTLQVAKQYEEKEIIDFSGGGDLPINEFPLTDKICEIKNTKYSFFLAIGEQGIYTISKNSKKIISKIIFDNGNKLFDQFCNSNVFQDYVFIRLKNNDIKTYTYKHTGRLGVFDFFSQIKIPYQSQRSITVDVYKLFQQQDIRGQTIIMPVFITSFRDNTIRLSLNNNGDITVAGINIPIKRLYTTYRQALSQDTITTTGMNVGDYFLVMSTFNKIDANKRQGYFIDGRPLDFRDAYKVTDVKYGGDYYTKLFAIQDFNNPQVVSVSDEITYGTQENFIKNRDNIIDFCEFQSRLCIATKDKLYFSKVLDITDFRTGVEQDSGFYIKPSTIEGNQSDIMKLVSGNGIYVLSTEGTYIFSYGEMATAQHQNIRIASTNNPTGIVTLIDDILYYIDVTGILRSIIPTYSNGVVQFTNITVDKYSHDKFSYIYLTKSVINNRNSLICTTNNNTKEFKVFEYVGENLFRRTTIEFKNNNIIIGFGQDLICGNKYYSITPYNMLHSQLVLNLPFIQTNFGGVYENDFTQNYNRCSINIFNKNNSYIKDVFISKQLIQPTQVRLGDYNVYDFKGSVSIMDFTIDLYMYTKQERIELKRRYDDLRQQRQGNPAMAYPPLPSFNIDNDLIGDSTIELRGINCWLK